MHQLTVPKGYGCYSHSQTKRFDSRGRGCGQRIPIWRYRFRSNEKPTDATRRGERPGMVCLLQKSMYGIREAGRIWGVVILNTLFEWGFKQSVADPCLLFYTEVEEFIIILIVVNDVGVSQTIERCWKKSRRGWKNCFIWSSSENWNRLLVGKFVRNKAVSRYHRAYMYHICSEIMKLITAIPYILHRWKGTHSPSTIRIGAVMSQSGRHVPTSSRSASVCIHMYPSGYYVRNFFPRSKYSRTISMTQFDDQACYPLLIRNPRCRNILSRIATTLCSRSQRILRLGLGWLQVD